MNNMVITIGRQYGSGGRMVGEALAERLGIPMYDKKLIELAAKESGLSEEFIRQAEQKRTSSFLYGLYLSSQSLPLADQVFLAESDVIRKVAEESCIIVGRCADYILRDHPRHLRVFVHAPLAERLRRAQTEYGVAEKEVAQKVARIDKDRSAYYRYFTNQPWGDLQNYDLTFNSQLGLDALTELLVSLYQRGNRTI